MKLSSKYVEKPWGQTNIPSRFDSDVAEGRKTGELWFEAPDGESLPLMIKYLFTSEKLSVQVHPDNEQAQAKGKARGKEECWYILQAEPDAKIGIGTRQTLAKEDLRESARSGEIEQLIDWKPVQAGDFFYIPAGTIHAIGAGVQLIEVQQNSDITYRLYDYGRPRELHLEDAIEVAIGAPYDIAHYQRVDSASTLRLVNGPYFCLYNIGGEDIDTEDMPIGAEWQVLPVAGQVTVEGQTVRPGECAVTKKLSEIVFSENINCFLATSLS